MITMIIKDTLQTAFIKKDLFFKIYFFLFYGQHQLKCSFSSSFESAATFLRATSSGPSCGFKKKTRRITCLHYFNYSNKCMSSTFRLHKGLDRGLCPAQIYGFLIMYVTLPMI